MLNSGYNIESIDKRTGILIVHACMGYGSNI